MSNDLKIDRIKKIVGGAGHSIILDDLGNVFTCGLNDKGQTGQSSNLNRINEFRKLNSLEGKKIVDVACGWDSSMALTDHGELFAWGSNFHGQLGLNRLETKINTPTKVECGMVIKKISIGLRHSAIVTRDSKVLTSGAASKGQLGIYTDNDEIVRNCNRFNEGIFF